MAQLAGAAADARADVYSFASSVREAIGQQPHARRDRQLERLLTAALSDEPAMRPGLARVLAALGPRRNRRNLIAIGTLIVCGLALAAVVATRPAPIAAERCDAGMAWDPVAWRATASAAPIWVQRRVVAVMADRAGEVVPLGAPACLGPAAERHAWIHCRALQAGTEGVTLESLSVRWPSYASLDDALALPWPSTCVSRAATLEAVLEPTGDGDRAALVAARAQLDRLRVARLANRPATDRSALRASLAAIAAPWPIVRERLAVPLALEDARALPIQRRTEVLEAAVALAERSGDSVGSAYAWLALTQVRVAWPPDGATTRRAVEQAGWAIERLGTPPELQVKWLGLATSRAWQHSDAAAARGYAARARELAGASPTQRSTVLHALVAAAGASADFATQRAVLEEILADPMLAARENALQAHLTYSSYAQCLYELGDQAGALAAIDRADRLGRIAGIGPRAQADVNVTRAGIELELGHPATSLELLTAAATLLAADPDDATLGQLFSW